MTQQVLSGQLAGSPVMAQSELFATSHEGRNMSGRIIDQQEIGCGEILEGTNAENKAAEAVVHGGPGKTKVGLRV